MAMTYSELAAADGLPPSPMSRLTPELFAWQTARMMRRDTLSMLLLAVKAHYASSC